MEVVQGSQYHSCAGWKGLGTPAGPAPDLSRAMAGTASGQLVALPGQCLETPKDQRLLGLVEILALVWHCPSRQKFVRQRVGFSLEEARVTTGPQRRCLSAGVNLGKVAGLVGWRLPMKQRHVAQGEGTLEERLRLSHQGGCQNAPQAVANGRVSGAQQDCLTMSHASLKEMFLRDGISWLGAARPALLYRNQIYSLEVAVLDLDKHSSGPTSFQSGEHCPADNI